MSAPRFALLVLLSASIMIPSLLTCLSDVKLCVCRPRRHLSMAEKERVYSEDEIVARLKRDLPHWNFEDGWIRRKYKTHSWKGTLMVINTVGHLAEAAWHHPDITASYAWVEVRLMNHAGKGRDRQGFRSWPKRSKTSFSGNRVRKAAGSKARRRPTSASPTSSTTLTAGIHDKGGHDIGARCGLPFLRPRLRRSGDRTGPEAVFVSARERLRS